MPARASILFICTGNICRSPLAEGVFLHRANARGAADRFTVDSAGTGGWHAGALPDRRSRAVAEQHGIVLPGRARQVTADDLRVFDHLVCMDVDNHEALLAMNAPRARLRMLMDFDPDAPVREVPDPYHGGEEDFLTVYGLVDRACARMLDHLLDGT